jgi:hypothetical protein
LMEIVLIGNLFRPIWMLLPMISNRSEWYKWVGKKSWLNSGARRNYEKRRDDFFCHEHFDSVKIVLINSVILWIILIFWLKMIFAPLFHE